MKTVLLSMLLLGPLSAQAQDAPDSTGLPGDNFSLQAALDLFKRSKNMECFEKALNDPDEKVNNLDLNGDGNVDYVRVVDNKDGDAHAIILEVPVSGKESQTVAVIELEKTGEKKAQVQIKGDETLYGSNATFEPTAENDKPGNGGHGPAAGDYEAVYVVVNVWTWPCVEYIYGPAYVVWVSPWYWGYYPGWYRPWHPRPFRVYYGYNRHYYTYYRPARVNGLRHADIIYVKHRRSSPMVVERTRTVHERRKAVAHPATAPGKAPVRTAPDRGTQAAPQQKKSAPDQTVQPRSKKEVRSVRRAERKAQRSKRRGGK
jgi:hypothetical protein